MKIFNIPNSSRSEPCFRTFDFIGALLKKISFSFIEDKKSYAKLDNKYIDKNFLCDIKYCFDNYKNNNIEAAANFYIYESMRLSKLSDLDKSQSLFNSYNRYLYKDIAIQAQIALGMIKDNNYNYIHIPFMGIAQIIELLKIESANELVNDIKNDIYQNTYLDLQILNLNLNISKANKELIYLKTTGKRILFLNKIKDCAIYLATKFWNESSPISEYRIGQMAKEVRFVLTTHHKEFKIDEKFIPKKLDWYKGVIAEVAPEKARLGGRPKKTEK